MKPNLSSNIFDTTTIHINVHNIDFNSFFKISITSFIFINTLIHLLILSVNIYPLKQEAHNTNLSQHLYQDAKLTKHIS